MYQENVNQSRCRALRLVVTIAMLLGAGSSANLAALDTINVSYPSPAPLYIQVAVALHQGFFREQHLDQLAVINPKDTPLSQMFDFSLLQQILKEGR